MLHDHVQNPNTNNRLKILYTFGRAELTISFANEFRPGSYGFKDQLMISKAICVDCRRRNKNLSTACIDYHKVFDSVPHRWEESQ